MEVALSSSAQQKWWLLNAEPKWEEAAAAHHLHGMCEMPFLKHLSHAKWQWTSLKSCCIIRGAVLSAKKDLINALAHQPEVSGSLQWQAPAPERILHIADAAPSRPAQIWGEHHTATLQLRPGH